MTPLLAGGCLAISKEVFIDIGGFEHGFKTWGREDEEISLKLWLMGYKCAVEPGCTVLHIFRQNDVPFLLTWNDINYNLMRLAYTHFNESRIKKCKDLIRYSDPDEITEKVLTSNVLEQREQYFHKRIYDDDWFMNKFSIPFEGTVLKKAVVVYLEKKRELLLQFGCLYTSFHFIKAKNTDLIVYGPIYALQRIPNDCIKVEYSPAKTDYPYIHSISNIANDHNALLNQYDYLLRTDMGTLLSPTWNSFCPKGFIVGRGDYIHDETVKNKIINISNTLGLTHKGIHNIGTSHYGPPQMIINVCKLSVYVSNYLLSNEFFLHEGKWPGWYRVLQQCIAMKFQLITFLIFLTFGTGKVRFLQYFRATICVNYPHFHCWHTNQPFSKFRFASGEYNDTPLEQLNINIVKDYCMYISLKALQEIDLIKGLFFDLK